MSDRKRSLTNAKEKKDALKRLADAKSGKRRQLDMINLDEERVYDEVTEEEYRKLVSHRRREDEFVVDGGLGYADDGEENWDADDPGAIEEEMLKNKEMNTSKRRRRSGVVPPLPKRVSNAFLRQQRKSHHRADDANAIETTSLMSTLLRGLRDNPTDGGDDVVHDEQREINNLEDTALYEDSINDVHHDMMKERVCEQQNTHTHSNDNGQQCRAVAPHSPTAAVVTSDVESSTISMMKAIDNATLEAPIEMKKKTINSSNISCAKMQDENNMKIDVEPSTDWQRVVDATEILPDTNQVHLESVNNLLDADNELTMFWIDAHEEVMHVPGRIYLFGQALVPNTTNQFVSCCVIVNDIERNLFVLPRPYVVQDPKLPRDTATDELVSMKDVYDEIREITHKHSIKRWKSKVVTRQYAFDNEDGNIPPEAQYLKVVYSAEYPSLERHMSGRTFSRVFGSASSTMERFLLKRKLMGPSWLKIKQARPHASAHSWCKAEFIIDTHKHISNQWQSSLEPPPLRVLSLNITCTFNQRKHCNEIVAVSGLVHHSVDMDRATRNANTIKHFTAICSSDARPWPLDLRATINLRKLELHLCANERSLLSFLLSQIALIDADVIVAHNLYGFILDVILHRCSVLRVPHWSKLSRLRRSRIPRTRAGDGLKSTLNACAGGRLFCDTQSSAKELVKKTTYSLGFLAHELLQMSRVELPIDQVSSMFHSTASVLQLAHHCENDAFLAMKLMFHLMILPLTKQLTCIGGNLWSRSLQSARAERIEFLLLHEFHRLKFIMPEKYSSRERKERADQAEGVTVKAGKHKAAYAGGLVLEPKKGLYDKYILLLDFNSLYPSIMQEFNLCFTTVQHWQLDGDGMATLPDATANPGVLPRVIKTLVDRRRSVKSLLAKAQNPVKRQQYEVRQQALKLVANSLYGCLGFSGSRFYCKSIAALITSQGRQILSATVALTESLGHDVVYGDTDSIMINTGQTDIAVVRDIGNSIKREVNKQYQTLEIEIDGMFKSMLLLQKKKYAALIVYEKNGRIETHRELKGIDMVRRDWCPLSKHVGEYVVDQILSGKPRDDVVNSIHEFLQSIAEQLSQRLVSLDRFIITKSISKMPHEYPNAHTLPHVNVAQQMIHMGMPVRVGDHIPYVICEGKESSPALRAQHPCVVSKQHPSSSSSSSSSMHAEIDTMWYLTHQILPPIVRLCAPIEGTDIPQLAQCLGLDQTKFRSYHDDTEGAAATEEAIEVAVCLRNLDDDEAFKEVEPLLVCCPFCSHTMHFSGVLNFESNCCGLACSACDAAKESNSEARLLVQLKRALRHAFAQHVARFNDYWLICTDSACRFRTRQPSPFGKQQCRSCRAPTRLEYPESALFLQLRFYQSLFDVERTIRRIDAENKQREIRKRNEATLSLVLSAQQSRVFAELKKLVDTRMLETSAYYYLQADDIFSMFRRRRCAPSSTSSTSSLTVH